MKDQFLIIPDFKRGWHKREDDSKIPLGGLRKSVNVQITDRGGISPRNGETLIGTASSVSSGIISLYSFRKADGDDILIRSYSDKLEYFNNKTSDWALIKDGYTVDQRFGFREHQTNSDFTDLLYFCNGIEPYSRWTGFEAYLKADVLAAATEVVVDTTLKEKVHYTSTSSASSTTTIDITDTDWATDVWNDFYVRITDGTKEGYISKISGTTGTQITFDTIAGLSGTPTFEIRELACDATGSIVYNGDTVAYTAVPKDDTFTVASAHAGSEDDALTMAPTEYLDIKKGNILETSVAQMFLAGVSEAPSTVFRSNLTDATDYSFSSPRSADEGDIAFFPYGGKNITDIIAQESTLYVFKPHSIESLTYTQDAEDIAQFNPIIKGNNVGTFARVWRQDDDIAFATPDNMITTIGRVVSKDSIPQMSDLAYNIRREVKNYNFDNVSGEENNNRAYVTAKSDKVVAKNDRMLVWNKDYKTWEGYWTATPSIVVEFKGKLVYGDAYNADVYELSGAVNKTRGEDVFPMSVESQTGWLNKNGTGFYLNEVSSIAVEGYITSGTEIKVNLYKDFASIPFQELLIIGTETEYQDGVPYFSVLGGDSEGIEPMGAASIIGDEEEDGRRHFIIYLNFQMTAVEYISVGFGSSGTAQSWEITSTGINATDTTFTSQNKVKN